MPIQRSISVFAASELSGSAKEKARGWFRYERGANAIAEDVTETGETLKPLLAALGIEVDEVLYSGYAVQGDGACFTGTYRFRPDWRLALAEVAGDELLDKLTRFGKQLDVIQAASPITSAARIVHNDVSYVHNCTIDAEPLTNDDDLTPEHQVMLHALTQAFQSIAYWVWLEMSEAEQALSSDDAIDDGLDQEGHVFDINGRYIG